MTIKGKDVSEIVKIVSFFITVAVGVAILYAKLHLLEYRMSQVEKRLEGLAGTQVVIASEEVTDGGVLCDRSR
jgi:hypothetical protein